MKRMIRFVLVAASVVLAACGGGGGSSGTVSPPPGGGGTGTTPLPFGFDTGIGGSGGTRGSIRAFGSIYVNDLRLDVDTAEFEIEDQQFMGLDGQSRLKEGQQIIAPFDVDSFDGSEYEAVEVYYRSDIKGPISAAPAIIDPLTGSAQFVVLGQTVITNAATRLSDIPDLALLAPGDLLEVSGTRDSTGNLVATFVERKPSLVEYKVVGVVTTVTATTFNLHGLDVDYSATGFDPAAGQIVEVKIDPAGFTAPASARARDIELLPVLRIAQTAEVEYEGYIDRFVSATDFAVNGLSVTTTAQTRYEGGSAADLAADVKVEVDGTVNASGVLVAEEVELKSTNAVRTESTIAAGGIDLAAGTVTTDVGLVFSIRSITELEDESAIGDADLTLADLAPGDFVEIRGFVDGATLVAVELKRNDINSDFRVRAPVTSINAATGQLELFGVVTLTATDADTSFQGAGSVAEFFAMLEIGTFVEARWNPWDAGAGTAAVVDELSIEDDD